MCDFRSARTTDRDAGNRSRRDLCDVSRRQRFRARHGNCGRCAGNAYVTGYTLSTDSRRCTPYDRSLGKSGDVDVFVAKLNAGRYGAGMVDLYRRRRQHRSRRRHRGRCVGQRIHHRARPRATTFRSARPRGRSRISGGGAFVAKLGPTGNTLAYSTYVAGATSNAIAVDRDGNAYVTGSATPAFATTAGALQRHARQRVGNGFVLKLNPTGSAPAYATFLGGTGNDYTAIGRGRRRGQRLRRRMDDVGRFSAWSARSSLPRGQKDAFVAKLDATGSRLVYSTLLGGALDDAINAIAVDAGGNAYVAGETYSSDFPSRAPSSRQGGRAPDQLQHGQCVRRKARARWANALVYSSFLGGEVCKTLCQLVFGPQPQYRADAAYGIAVDAGGHAYVTGIARSYTFPLVDSAAIENRRTTKTRRSSPKISASGASPLWSTFLRTGFNESDNGWTRFPPGAATGVAIDRPARRT